MRPEPQPAVAILAMRRIPKRQVARTLDISETYTSRVLLGYETPSRRFREGVSALLGLPESMLFRAPELVTR